MAMPGRLLLALVLAATGALAQAAAPAPLRPEVDAFVDEVVAKHGLVREDVRRILTQARVQRDILRAMSMQSTARPWHRYRPLYVNPDRIAGGVRFWRENAELLARASREHGVPEEIIVATIGVETIYGRYMGTHRVLDALTTLAFDFPRRAEFFRGELEQFLLLARDGVLDALAVRGSYAGAIGIPQFMPSSYQRFAVDFDGDGRIRLVDGMADAIGSVANYYRVHGWVTGAPVVLAATVEGDGADALVELGIEPQLTPERLKAAGVMAAWRDGAGPAALLKLEAVTGPQYWLGMKNFYVITRYNRSVNYAMSVHELAQEIRAAYQSVRTSGAGG
jgi:membrane-bound lytic murein transglycosylase B